MLEDHLLSTRQCAVEVGEDGSKGQFDRVGAPGMIMLKTGKTALPPPLQLSLRYGAWCVREEAHFRCQAAFA